MRETNLERYLKDLAKKLDSYASYEYPFKKDGKNIDYMERELIHMPPISLIDLENKLRILEESKEREDQAALGLHFDQMLDILDNFGISWSER